jgi:tetratricopeptide (TPR) repeat protein
MKKKVIKMTSKIGSEFDAEVVIGKEKYLVQTEDGGVRTPQIITQVYLNGRILSTQKSDYRDILDAPDREEQVRKRMQKQHQHALSLIRKEKVYEKRTTSEYLEEVKDNLKNKNKKHALRLLNEALEHYPDDPFLLSYYGCLEAIVNNNYTHGITTCTTAIETLKSKVPFGAEFFYPVFYLNLGRAYIAAGKKREAIDTFNTGISFDSENADLLWEIRKLGMRKKPAVAFLKRSNPINKYIGALLHALRK